MDGPFYFRHSVKTKQKYHEDVLDLDDGLLSGSLDRLAILWDVALVSSFLLDILALHKSFVEKRTKIY